MSRALGFRHIETIHAVVLTGSVTGAAARLHLSQPAISNVLRDAEERLGFKLFERRGGRLIPTAQADLLFNEIERSFTGLEAINAFAARLDVGRRSLSVACTPAFGAAVLPAVLQAHGLAQGPVVVSVHSRIAHHVAALVSSGKADVGFGLEVPMVPGVAREPIAELPLLCYFAPDHPLAAQAEVLPAQLADQAMISLSSAEGVDGLVAAALTDAAVPAQGLRTVIECPAAISACAMAAAGLGVLLFDALPAQIFDPARVAVRPLRTPVRLKYCAYWLSSRSDQRDLHALVDLARTHMQGLAQGQPNRANA